MIVVPGVSDGLYLNPDILARVSWSVHGSPESIGTREPFPEAALDVPAQVVRVREVIAGGEGPPFEVDSHEDVEHEREVTPAPECAITHDTHVVIPITHDHLFNHFDEDNPKEAPLGVAEGADDEPRWRYQHRHDEGVSLEFALGDYVPPDEPLTVKAIFRACNEALNELVVRDVGPVAGPVSRHITWSDVKLIYADRIAGSWTTVKRREEAHELRVHDLFVRCNWIESFRFHNGVLRAQIGT